MLVLELNVFVCDIHSHQQPRKTHLYPLCSCRDAHHPQQSLQRGQRAAAAQVDFAQESWTCWSSVSWPSPVDPNRTSPLCPWARNPPVTHVCRVTAGQEGNKALPEVLPQTQGALWDTAELFVLLHQEHLGEMWPYQFS